jgi:hypothetical protein
MKEVLQSVQSMFQIYFLVEMSWYNWYQISPCATICTRVITESTTANWTAKANIEKNTHELYNYSSLWYKCIWYDASSLATTCIKIVPDWRFFALLFCWHFSYKACDFCKACSDWLQLPLAALHINRHRVTSKIRLTMPRVKMSRADRNPWLAKQSVQSMFQIYFLVEMSWYNWYQISPCATICTRVITESTTANWTAKANIEKNTHELYNYSSLWYTNVYGMMHLR